MVESTAMPSIRRLHGGVLIPYNAAEATRENENGESETFCRFQQVKLNQHVLPGLAAAQTVVWKELQKDLHGHIYPHYDQGSQSTIQAYAQRAERLGRSNIVDECGKILDWIDECLSYYYTKKDAIFATSDTNELMLVNWNFSTNQSVPKNLMGLRAIKGMFA